MLRQALAISAAACAVVHGYTPPLPLARPAPAAARSRRAFAEGGLAAALGLGAAAIAPQRAGAAIKTTVFAGYVGRTRNPGDGYTYSDGAVGGGKSPEWGDLVVVEYTGYVQGAEAGAPLREFESSRGLGNNFLFKHGNGRITRALDDAVHGMKVGGARRIEIPVAELGRYGEPLPVKPEGRELLGNQIEKLSGSIVFDLRLVDTFPDDNDQGIVNDDMWPADQIQDQLPPRTGGE